MLKILKKKKIFCFIFLFIFTNKCILFYKIYAFLEQVHVSHLVLIQWYTGLKTRSIPFSIFSPPWNSPTFSNSKGPFFQVSLARKMEFLSEFYLRALPCSSVTEAHCQHKARREREKKSKTECLSPCQSLLQVLILLIILVFLYFVQSF